MTYRLIQWDGGKAKHRGILSTTVATSEKRGTHHQPKIIVEESKPDSASARLSFA